MAPRIVFVTPWDVTDPAAWSGVIQPMLRSLQRRTEVEVLSTRGLADARVDRWAMRLLDGRGGKRLLPGHLMATARRRGKELTGRLRATEAGAVIGVAASQDLAFLETDLPVVHVSDATFAAIQDFYPLYADLHPWAARQGEQVERRALHVASAVAAASGWAARSVVQDYGIDPSRVEVAPFGPRCTGAEDPRAKSGAAEALRVLVVASNWVRKGGDSALAAVAALRQSGRDATLTAVGDHPSLPEWATGLGRVEPSRMPEIYADHDVLLELATANAAGVTLTDAAHAGLPVVATRTGGVETIVINGVTGVLVSPGNSMVTETVAGLSILTDPMRRQQMGVDARAHARETLSWETWANAVLQLAWKPRHQP